MLEITLYHEKDGEIKTSDYNNKKITEKNLDFVLVQFISNFGFDVIEIKKDGNVLKDDDIKAITEKYPCKDKFDELDAYFHSSKTN